MARKTAAQAKQELAALLFQCRRCSCPADYRCETAKVLPPRKVRRGSLEQVIQEFESYHLCFACCRDEVLSDTPPAGSSHSTTPSRPSRRRAASSSERRSRPLRTHHRASAMTGASGDDVAPSIPTQSNPVRGTTNP